MIRTDRGQEFRSKDDNAYLKGQNIHHFYALNTEIKANYDERLIKHKLFRYMLKTELNVISTSYKMQFTGTIVPYIEVWVSHQQTSQRTMKVRVDYSNIY